MRAGSKVIATTTISITIIAVLIVASLGSLGVSAFQIGAGQAITIKPNPPPTYILAGGQKGQWFTPSQYPELYKVSLSNSGAHTASLPTDPGMGSVWSGGWNGSDWLITGWGWGDSQGLNPNFVAYNNQAQTELSFSNTPEASTAEQEWSGGDVFSSTWNGSTWLLTGMGSGVLDPSDGATNHYSMAFLTSNGTFIDLSQSIPNNQDGILYASAWNGTDWLVGGGYYGFNVGVLYLVSPSGDVVDISSLMFPWVPNFNSVQSIAWNGTDWMIGGVGFLEEYNPSTGAVYDLTGALDFALSAKDSLNNLQINSINSVIWTGTRWMLAGGAPVGFQGSENQTAWVASFDPVSGTFTDLTAKVIPSSILSKSPMSSILSMACNDLGCALGGFAGSNPVLIWYNGSNTINLASTMPSGSMNYVQWVGVSGESSVVGGTPTSHSAGA